MELKAARFLWVNQDGERGNKKVELAVYYGDKEIGDRQYYWEIQILFRFAVVFIAPAAANTI